MLATACNEKFTPLCRNLSDVDPLSVLPQCEEPRDRVAPTAKVASSPLDDRASRQSAGDLAKALHLRWSRSAKDFAAGAAFLAAWCVLWSLLIFAYQSPLERADGEESIDGPEAVSIVPWSTDEQPMAWDGQSQTIDSRSLNHAPLSCPVGMVELDGRCVLGEEIEVRPPAGWRRGFNGTASVR